MNASLHKTLRAARGYLLGNIGKLSDEQWLVVPDDFSNNILWNVGHLLHSHNTLTYGASGLDTGIPAEYEGLFKGGTSPATWSETPNVAEVRERFGAQMEKLIAAHETEAFANFKAYELMPGYTLDNIDDAMNFVLFHESLHVEAISMIKKRVVA